MNLTNPTNSLVLSCTRDADSCAERIYSPGQSISGVSFSMDQDRTKTVAELWKVHRAAAFPGRLRSADISGVDMVMLDADVAGCVSSWLNNGGAMDDGRWEVLAARERQLERVVPELSGHEGSYCRGLLDMTALVLRAPSNSRSG